MENTPPPEPPPPTAEELEELRNDWRTIDNLEIPTRSVFAKMPLDEKMIAELEDTDTLQLLYSVRSMLGGYWKDALVELDMMFKDEGEEPTP